MDTGLQSQSGQDDSQPNNAVVAELETTGAKPQADATEETEVHFDDSSDNQETSHKTEMSQAQAYAAFQKKKKQSAQRKQELDASAVREQKLQDELNELKATVGKMVKGKPPTLEQFEYDEDQYQKAVREYYSEPKTKKEEKQTNTSTVSNPANEEAEFYLYQREQELTKALPDYEQAKQSVADAFSKTGLIKDNNVAFNYIASVAKQKNIDAAKVIFAMSKSPKILDDLLAAGNNAFAVADILTEAESKVKTRSKVKIDSKPEPEITNSGPIDNNNEVVKKARQKWVDNPSQQNYKAYQAARTKKVN